MSDAQLIVHAGEGYHILMRDGFSIASDSDYDLAHSAKTVLKVRGSTLNSGKICHIGGGLALIPQLLGPSFEHIILDCEPACAQFVPNGATFVHGDWIGTIAKHAPYDAIIWDLGGLPPDLTIWLAPGGIVVS